jgi:antitoxin FitA
MAQVVVRNIDDDVKARLKQRAAQHGWSMEEEVRQILRKAVAEPRPALVKLGSRMAARFAGVGLSGELPQLQGQAVVPMDFGT